MDELEKKVPEVEVTDVEATEVETPEVEAAAGEPTEGACVAETEEAPARNVHAMSKEELVAAMKEILENDKMESHREVTAMKQAFFSLRSREPSPMSWRMNSTRSTLHSRRNVRNT